MTNVATSINTAAQRCVKLPVDLKAQKLCVIYLFFRQWTGTATMRRADYTIGKDGYLPPEEVTANYGQKRVIDPVHLRVFDTLKKRAETLLADHGLPFCKGMVLPVDKAAGILTGLRAIADEYNRARDNLASSLDEKCREWIASNPQFAEQIRAAQPNVGNIVQRINADFAVFRFVPAEVEIDQTDSLKRTVDGLFDEVIDDVVKRSRLLHKRSVSGKTADDLSQRTLSTFKVMKEKLTGLRFLNGGVSPIIDLIDRLLALMPSRGKFSPDQFNALNASLGILCDEQLIKEVATGKLTLDGYLANALPAFALTVAAQNPKSNNLASTEVPKINAGYNADEPNRRHSIGETKPLSDAACAVPNCESPAVIEAESEAKAESTSEDEKTEKADRNETKTDDFEDLNRMLEMCFGSDGSGESSQEQPSPNAPAIPPAPGQLQLSAF